MKTFNYLLIMLLISLCASCQLRGPKGAVYMEDKSMDDMVKDIFDAANGDGWVYYYDVDLHKKVQGSWMNVGRHKVYANLADKEDYCNLWVQFGESFCRLPAELTQKAGYSYCVKYKGEYYYF